MLAKMRNIGEACTAANRFLIHESVAEEFGRRFAERMAALRVGKGTVKGVDVGTLVDRKARESVDALVQEAVAGGAKILTGGGPLPGKGWFYAPTVLTDVPASSRIAVEEIFGPVAPISTFATEAEAIARANDTAYGLNASIWSRDVRAARALARRIRAGTVNINDGYAAAWGASGAPMGGMGQSGLGRRHGPEGITKYTESQTIAAQHLVPIAPFGGLDDRQFATALTVGLKLLRRAGLR